MSSVSDPETRLSQRAARVLLWVEKYPLPLLYGWFAWQRWETLRNLLRDHYTAGLAAPDAGTLHLYYAQIARNALLLLLMLFSAITLLLNRAPKVLPDKLKQVVVPVAASFYFVLYGTIDSFPPPWSENLAPPAWRAGLLFSGIVFSAVGYAISIWALCYLRRSFAMLVAVRRVVLGGPYAYVRHPMYLGYLCDTLGLLLVTCAPAMLLLAVGFVVLMTVRARLEEESLALASAEYKQRYWRTGFFFPRWRGSVPTRKANAPSGLTGN